jgi:hypothetical protein
MKTYNSNRIVNVVTNKSVIFMAALAAIMVVMPSIMSIQPAEAAGTWSQIGTVRYLNIANHNPEGQMSLIVPVYKNSNDGSSTKDWFEYRAKQNAVPGKQAFGSNWVNDWMDFKLDIVPSNQFLSEHDPITDSVSPATISIAFPVSISFTYTIPEMTVTDKTVYAGGKPWWEHDWTGGLIGTPRTTAYTSSPTFTMETVQGDAALVNGWYHYKVVDQICQVCGYQWGNTNALFFDSTMAT